MCSEQPNMSNNHKHDLQSQTTLVVLKTAWAASNTRLSTAIDILIHVVYTVVKSVISIEAFELFTR